MAHQFALNGSPILDGRLWLPRSGAWTAELTLPDKTSLAPGQAVTLTPEAGVALAGTLVGAGSFEDATRVRVVGGGGGLGKRQPPKTFRDLALGSVLSDTLGPAGERLAASSASAVTSYRVRAYVRREQPASATLHYWAADRGATWRVLPDGSVWLGADTFAPAAAFDYALLSSRPDASADTIATESLVFLPGTTFGGKKVSAVVYTLGAAVRAEVLYEWS